MEQIKKRNPTQIQNKQKRKTFRFTDKREDCVLWVWLPRRNKGVAVRPKSTQLDWCVRPHRLRTWWKELDHKPKRAIHTANPMMEKTIAVGGVPFVRSSVGTVCFGGIRNLKHEKKQRKSKKKQSKSNRDNMYYHLWMLRLSSKRSQ